MTVQFDGFKSILVASDFSEHASIALARAVWIAQRSSKRLVVAHVVADLRKAVHQTSYRARLEFLEGNDEHFQRELRRQADEKLKRQIAGLGATEIDIKYETLLGEPYEELIHSVQQESYDLVVAGMRGYSTLPRLVLGSTALRLVRKCPASVWIVKRKEADAPKSILVAVDMSDASQRALSQAAWTAERAGAELHIVHVVESTGLSADLLDTKVAGAGSKSLRALIEAEAGQQFQDFVGSAKLDGVRSQTHFVWGSPAHETVRLAGEVAADLVVMGTVGRKGVEQFFLGSTAESVLTNCECDVLAVKPVDFVSPIKPAAWPLHPGPEAKQ
jgi:universal stress protein E